MGRNGKKQDLHLLPVFFFVFLPLSSHVYFDMCISVYSVLALLHDKSPLTGLEEPRYMHKCVPLPGPVLCDDWATWLFFLSSFFFFFPFSFLRFGFSVARYKKQLVQLVEAIGCVGARG